MASGGKLSAGTEEYVLKLITAHNTVHNFLKTVTQFGYIVSFHLNGHRSYGNIQYREFKKYIDQSELVPVQEKIGEFDYNTAIPEIGHSTGNLNIQNKTWNAL